MKIRMSSALAIVLLGVLVFNLAGNVYTVEAYSLCPAATFVADVTIPDGTLINPGTSFTKIWRLKNTGTCAWTNKFALVFFSGEQMGGMSPIFLPRFVSPGQNIDVSVDLTAPTSGGTYRGYWKLQNANGTQFGIGGAASNAFWVEIRVLGPTTSVVAYDFIQNMCGGLWVYDGGPIPCPVNFNKTQFGYVLKLDNPTMENGLPAGAPALLTVPQNKFNGAIHGIFNVDSILQGDHFVATVGCQYGATQCAVTYQVDFGTTNDNFMTIWKHKETYDGLFYQVDIPLGSLRWARNPKIMLSVIANGGAVGDLALWVNPQIVRDVQSPVVTPTPSPIPPTPGPTPTPLPVACTDRAQFITDVTIPDGTVLAPNANFFKQWRLKNVGTCTWTTSYDLTFVSGESMGASDTPLPQTVFPGQTVDAGVNLVAPSLAGSYRGNWELKNASGQIFGIGSLFDHPFWVQITVSGSAPAVPTWTPTTTVPATGTPVTPSPTAAASSPTPVNTGWFVYTDAKYAFDFQVPPGSTISSQNPNSGRVYLPFTAGTNLFEKYLDVQVVDGATTCKSPYSNAGATSQTVTINGIQFLKETETENAVGNVYNWTGYSTMKGTSCISMTFVLHSNNPGVFPTPPPVFDQAAESAVFTTIMSSYGNF